MDFHARNYDAALGRWMNVDPLAEKYFNISPYVYVANNPIIYIDPDGKEIIGVNRKSAENFHEDINRVLSDEKFDNFRSLITRGKNNNRRTFDKIDEIRFNEAISSLEGDDKLLSEILYNAINSENDFVVEYIKDEESTFSKTGKEVFASELNRLFNFDGDKDKLKGSNLIALGGSGYSAPTNSGSHSFVVNKSNHLEGERALTSFHEVLGHGVPHSRSIKGKLNSDNAIRLENLIRRVMGIETMRDGTNPIHAGGLKVPNHTASPMKN